MRVSRIKWQLAISMIRQSTGYRYTDCPVDWPERLPPVFLAHLQAPPTGKDYSRARAWQAAIENAVNARELPSALQVFAFEPMIAVGLGSAINAGMEGRRYVHEPARPWIKEWPDIAAADFKVWLASEMETPSELVADWFDARCTAPAQTAAPVVTGRKWTPEKLAELKAYREAHTMPETAAEFRISEARIRKLLPTQKPKAEPFAALVHRIK